MDPSCRTPRRRSAIQTDEGRRRMRDTKRTHHFLVVPMTSMWKRGTTNATHEIRIRPIHETRALSMVEGGTCTARTNRVPCGGIHTRDAGGWEPPRSTKRSTKRRQSVSTCDRYAQRIASPFSSIFLVGDVWRRPAAISHGMSPTDVLQGRGGAELGLRRDVDPIRPVSGFHGTPFSLGRCIGARMGIVSSSFGWRMGPYGFPSHRSIGEIVRGSPIQRKGTKASDSIPSIHPSIDRSMRPSIQCSLVPLSCATGIVPFHTFRRLNRPRAPQDACDLRLPIGEEQDERRKNNRSEEGDAKKKRRKKDTNMRARKKRRKSDETLTADNDVDHHVRSMRAFHPRQSGRVYGSWDACTSSNRTTGRSGRKRFAHRQGHRDHPGSR